VKPPPGQGCARAYPSGVPDFLPALGELNLIAQVLPEAPGMPTGIGHAVHANAIRLVLGLIGADTGRRGFYN